MTSQEGLDGSPVLAGIVHYPPQSPMNQYFLGSWTIIHQLGALFATRGSRPSLCQRAFLSCAVRAHGRRLCGRRLLFQRPVSDEPFGGAALFSDQPVGEIFRFARLRRLGLLWSQPPVQTFGFWAHAGSVWGGRLRRRGTRAGFPAVVLIAVHPVLGVYMIALLTATLLAGRLFLGLDIQGFAKGAALGALVLSRIFRTFDQATASVCATCG